MVVVFNRKLRAFQVHSCKYHCSNDVEVFWVSSNQVPSTAFHHFGRIPNLSVDNIFLLLLQHAHFFLSHCPCRGCVFLFSRVKPVSAAYWVYPVRSARWSIFLCLAFAAASFVSYTTLHSKLLPVHQNLEQTIRNITWTRESAKLCSYCRCSEDIHNVRGHACYYRSTS